MEIKWNKGLLGEEERRLNDYLNGRMGTLERLIGVLSEDLMIISFTPPPIGNNFYTFEIRYIPAQGYLLNVWKGIRTGDAAPLMWGFLKE